MRRIFALLLAAVAAFVLVATPAAATIHPIVESFDCANEQAFAHHPLGDPADPAGQTPGATPGNGQNELAALGHANGNAWFGHKLDGECGGKP
jgi:hypothetical protein